MENVYIHIAADTTNMQINEIHVKNIPYFIELQKNYSTYGTKENPFRFDIDKKQLEYLVDYLRNGDRYDFPENESSILDLIYDTKIDSPNTFIKINVGEYMYYTTPRTLSKSGYFSAYFKWNQQIPKHIDRNGKIFRKILRYLRNSKYTLPKKYQFELDFFNIENNELKKNVWRI